MWNVVVVCEGKPHRLSITDQKIITIHDHPGDGRRGERDGGWGRGSVTCACDRVKAWLPKGIYIIAVIP